VFATTFKGTVENILAVNSMINVALVMNFCTTAQVYYKYFDVDSHGIKCNILCFLWLCRSLCPRWVGH
jgi:hypothetical protein